MIEKYRRSGLVEYAEPDYIRQLDAAPNDPKFLDGTLWALNNYGQGGGTPGADLHATNAWDILESASNVVVAILDTGGRYTHQDLAANVWTSTADGSHGTNAIAGNNDPNDDNGHGTLIAGVVGAVGNNGIGVTGVAWRMQMMFCKCFDSLGAGSDSAILACIDFARRNGARVINASFDSTAYSISLSNAIYATEQAGIIFVASSGNSNPGVDVDVTPHYPACYRIDNIVSVAYTTRNDALGILSNYGATNVMLAAPGDQIYSTFASSDSAYYPPSGLSINLAGTSFAAGYVSGAAALMLARYPGVSCQRIIALLRDSTDALPGLQGKCATGGRLNLRKALHRPLLATIPGDGDHFRVLAGPERTCVIEASSDLITWSSMLTNSTSADGFFDFTANDGGMRRFYRATANE